jgi:hypothetical protein
LSRTRELPIAQVNARLASDSEDHVYAWPPFKDSTAKRRHLIIGSCDIEATARSALSPAYLLLTAGGRVIPSLRRHDAEPEKSFPATIIS